MPWRPRTARRQRSRIACSLWPPRESRHDKWNRGWTRKGLGMDLYVVTGATRGLGEALARSIAANPGNRLLTLGRAPGDATNIPVDFSDAAAAESVCGELE